MPQKHTGKEAYSMCKQMVAVTPVLRLPAAAPKYMSPG
jgi:hypothetical protein